MTRKLNTCSRVAWLCAMLLTAAAAPAARAGTLVSWGLDNFGQISGTPAGNDFVEVSAGGLHNIARRADGSLAS